MKHLKVFVYWCVLASLMSCNLGSPPPPMPAGGDLPTPSQTSVSVPAPTINAADLIFLNGDVITMDAANPGAEAVAVQNGFILAIGTNDEILLFQGENTVLMDLQGHTLMPGFVDTHSHIALNAQGDPDVFEQIQREAIQGGITTETEMGVTPELLDQLTSYDRAGLMHIRWNVYFLYNTNCGEPFDKDWYKTYEQGTAISPHIRTQGVKLFSDGGSCHVPAVTFEYPGGYGYGDLFMTQDQLTDVVGEIQSAGYQIAIHALGDRAVEEAQNAIAAALNGSSNIYRHRIEHNAVVHDELLPRYNQIGIVPIIFGSYATCLRDDPNSKFKYVVPVKLGTWEWTWRALLDSNPGVRAAWHSDYAVFPNIAPMAHLYGFVTRNQVADDGSICLAPDWLKQGAITVDEALHIMTINSAYALFRDHEVGSLEKGKLADMIVLSENPLQVEPEAIRDISVLMTMIDGQVKYCAQGSESLCPSPQGKTNAPPIGFIDIPTSDESLSGTIEIAGWALDDSGIERVEIYIDGNFTANAVYGYPRPDVENDYPGRTDSPNFGFTYSMDTTLFSNGPHIIQVWAFGKSGNKALLTPESLMVTVKN